MAIPTTVDDLNAFTNRYVVPKCVDVVYKNSPLFTRMITKGRVDFPGGTSITIPIMYAKLKGGFFAREDTFDISYVKTDAAFSIVPKYTYVNVTLYGTDDVLNRGREAAFSLVETKMANAAARMAELIATAMYQDGQSSSGDVTASGGVLSTSASLDGLLAWVDDGNDYGAGGYTTATDVTKSFPTIGGLTRDDLFTAAPTFTGATTPLTAIGGANAYTDRAFTTFALSTISAAIGHAWYGSAAPDILLTQQAGYQKIWNAVQPNQRFMATDSDLAKVGFKSFTLDTVSVVVDKHMPANLALILNTDFVSLYVSNNPKFQMGFTGFKEAQNSINLSGQILFAGNMAVSNPRTCAKLIGSALS